MAAKQELEKQLKTAYEIQIEWSKTAKKFWVEIESQKMVLYGIISGVSGSFLVSALNEWFIWINHPADPHHALEGLGWLWATEVVVFGTVFIASLILVVQKLESAKKPYLFALKKHKEIQSNMAGIEEELIQESAKKPMKPV